MNLIRRGYYEVVYQIASIYELLGNIDNAISLLERLKKQHPQDIAVWHSLMICYTRKGNRQQIKTILEEGLVVHPNDWILHRFLIEMLHASGAPLEQIIPHIQAYFRYKPSEQGGFPALMTVVAKLSHREAEWKAETERFETYLEDWDRWAMHMLQRYENK